MVGDSWRERSGMFYWYSTFVPNDPTSIVTQNPLQICIELMQLNAVQ